MMDFDFDEIDDAGDALVKKDDEGTLQELVDTDAKFSAMVFEAMRDRHLEIQDKRKMTYVSSGRFDGSINELMIFDQAFSHCDGDAAFKEIDAMEKRMMEESLRGDYLLEQIESLKRIKEILSAFNAVKVNNRFTLDVI